MSASVTPAGLWSTQDDVSFRAYTPKLTDVPSVSEMRILTSIRPTSPPTADDGHSNRKIPRPPSSIGLTSRPTSSAAAAMRSHSQVSVVSSSRAPSPREQLISSGLLQSAAGGGGSDDALRRLQRPNSAWLKRPPLATDFLIRQEQMASPRQRKMITAPTRQADTKRPTASVSAPLTNITTASQQQQQRVGRTASNAFSTVSGRSAATSSASPSSVSRGGGGGSSKSRAGTDGGGGGGGGSGGATFKGVPVARPSVTEGTNARPTSSFALVTGLIDCPQQSSRGGEASREVYDGEGNTRVFAHHPLPAPSTSARAAANNPYEVTYIRNERYDSDNIPIAERTSYDLDHFEFFKARRLMRTSLPLTADEAAKPREQCLREAIREIKRERITKQNGPIKLHFNLGPADTTDHVYIRYRYPHNPFPTKLTRWLLHMVAMQHHPIVVAMKAKFFATTLPVSGKPTFTIEEMVRELALPPSYDAAFNIVDDAEEKGGLAGSGRKGNREWMDRFMASRSSAQGRVASMMGGPAASASNSPASSSPNEASAPTPLSHSLQQLQLRMGPPLTAKERAVADWVRTATFRRAPKILSPRRFYFDFDAEREVDRNADEAIKPYPPMPPEVSTDPHMFPLKQLWARHADYDALLGMPYSADNFRRFVGDALYEEGRVARTEKQHYDSDDDATSNGRARRDVKAKQGQGAGGGVVAAAAAPEKRSSSDVVTSSELKEVVEKAFNEDEDDGIAAPLRSAGPSALPPPPPWSLETPLIDPVLCDELFSALNGMSTQHMSYPTAMLYLHLLLLRAIPAVQEDLLKVLLSLARKRMAMRKLEITAQDFFTTVLLLEQFLETCSTVPPSSAHPADSAYQRYNMKSNCETGVDVSVIQTKTAAATSSSQAAASSTRANINSTHRDQKEETVLPKVGVPSPAVVALLNRYRDEIQQFSDNIPKDNYALHFDLVFDYFPKDSIFVQHMFSDADEAVKKAFIEEAAMLQQLPKYNEPVPTVSAMMPYAVSTWRGVERVVLQRALLAEVAEHRRQFPRSTRKSVRKSGAQSYVDRPPCMI